MPTPPSNKPGPKPKPVTAKKKKPKENPNDPNALRIASPPPGNPNGDNGL